MGVNIIGLKNNVRERLVKELVNRASWLSVCLSLSLCVCMYA